MTMDDEVKRLSIKSATLRELYLKSGNQCAFPGCSRSMVDENGNFVGQICHIEAAQEGGERFNPQMSNEERRDFKNLMLMCYDHHIETNKVEKYPVEKLKEMKRQHEEKFSNVIAQMKNAVNDYGHIFHYKKAFTGQRLSAVMEFGLTDEQMAESLESLNKLIDKLKDVPIVTRTLLSIMVSRSYRAGRMKRGISGECVVPIHEIEAATGKDKEFIKPQLEILNRRGIISDNYYNDNDCPCCDLLSDIYGWDYWNDIREFCIRTKVPLDKICVDLDFSVFDE